MTLGEPQIIRIPDNTFEYPLHLMLNLLLHEMIHGTKKLQETLFMIKRERMAGLL
jgi:hypothetical protein